MAPTFNPNQIEVGPGTLYAAPLGTTEPTAVTGAWPSGWQLIGYTDQGSTFTVAPSFAAVTVEESIWPIRNVADTYKATVAFAMSQTTQQNWNLAMNAGLGSSLVSGTTGTNPDGSLWSEPPVLGTEARVMLGWDSLPVAATAGTNPFGRSIWRQCIQTGQVAPTRRKGSNKATYSVAFDLELPTTGLQPFRMLWPASLAS